MKTLIVFALMVTAMLSCSAGHAGVTSQWHVVLTKGSSNVFVNTYKASTREAAETACAAGVPTSVSTGITYTCNAARRVFVVTPTVATCQPAPPSRPGTCPTGTTGTWTQVATVGPAPTCTVTWSSAPEGACTPIPVNTVLLTWDPPTQNTDGTPLSNLAGYYIHRGASPTALVNSFNLAVPGASAYRISDLASGTYYFAVSAYNSNGGSSALSNIRSFTIP